ncbi:unnamed protein product [Mytilus coruscus]|uniref:Uncharacterized protein n=1 Tax=Mytilus coruscus TaxID=42192 RepID=A0A6J7ZTP7_MYTCO|nr:unnamed protein product [Mytilus coruscus]
MLNTDPESTTTNCSIFIRILHVNIGHTNRYLTPEIKGRCWYTTLLNKIIQQATNGKWKEQQNTSSLFSKPLPKCPDSNILDTSLIQEASTSLQPLDHPGTAMVKERCKSKCKNVRTKESEHRTSDASKAKDHQKPSMDVPDLHKLIGKSVSLALDEVIQNPFYKSTTSFKGQCTIKLASSVKDENKIVQQIIAVIKQPFTDIVKSTENDCSLDLSPTERLFNKYYSLTTDKEIQSQLSSILLINVSNCTSLPVEWFLAVLQDDILNQFIGERKNTTTRKIVNHHSCPTLTSQFYFAYVVISEVF